MRNDLRPQARRCRLYGWREYRRYGTMKKFHHRTKKNLIFMPITVHWGMVKVLNLVNKEGKIMEGFNAGMKGAKGSADEGCSCAILCSLAGKIWARRKLKISAHIDLLPNLRYCGIVNCRKAKFMAVSPFPYLRTQRQRRIATIYPKGRWKTGKMNQQSKVEGFLCRNGCRPVENNLDMKKYPPNKMFLKISQVKSMRKLMKSFGRETRPLMVNRMFKCRQRVHISSYEQIKVGNPD